MSNQTNLPVREYGNADAAMIVGIGAIVTSALKYQSALAEEDTTLTTSYLKKTKEQD